MSHNELKAGRRGGRGLVEARQRRRFLPALLGLEDRKLLATFTVTNTLDDGSTGSLRWAVGQANSTSGNNTVDFNPSVFATPQTIALTGGVLDLSDTSGTETIIGPAAGVTIDAGGSSGVINVAASVTASISGVTVTNGSVTGNGGAVYNAATLAMTDCTISGSTATGVGGGVFNSGYGTMTLTDCTISGNSNSGRYGGGGVYNDGAITLTGCTISGNSSYYNGGGLYINYGTAVLTDCTITGNTSSGLGGGLEAFAASVTLTNCTVSGNTSGYAGGGIYSIFYSTMTLTNTIVAGNSTDITGNVSGSNNLIGTGGAGGLVNGVNGNIVGVSNPALSPLGNYGGPTETIALLPGSLAIDAGTSSGAPTNDQRGESRYGAVDIGSFESQGFTFTVVPGGSPQTATIGTAFANPLAVTVTANNPIEPVDGGIVNFVASPASNGASAIFSTSPGIIASGTASVLAAPDNVDGTYTVVGSSTGFSTSFTLTNIGTPIPSLVVNTTSDSTSPGPGLLSLREAIGLEGPGSFPLPPLPITFDPTVFATPQTIDLTNGQLELIGSVTITGPAAGVTIDAGGTSRVLQVDSGVLANITGLTFSGGAGVNYGGGVYDDGGNLTLTDCTITGNSSGLVGGGLFNTTAGTLTLNGCVISGNSAYYSYAGYYGTYIRGYGGGLLNAGNATLNNCTVSGNLAGAVGGGIESVGTIALTDTTISGNMSSNIGGGFVNLHNTATLTDCLITGNTAAEAAGVYNGYDGTSTLTGCTISGNAASGKAGGFYNGQYSKATLSDCTISGNTATTVGGGMSLDGTVTMTGSTISGNYADGEGGGIYVGNAATTLTNCTIAGNTGSDGGGIEFFDSSSNDLVDCTITGNTASAGNGGGIRNDYSTVSLINSIVALNYGQAGAGDLYLITSAPYLPIGTISGNNNLIGTGGSGGLVDGVDGNLVGVADPGLSALGNYGGPTETIGLLPGSPAIGAGSSVDGVTTDQRGITIGDTPDIGSFYSEGFTYIVVPGSTPQVAGTGSNFDEPLAVTVTPVNPLDPVVGGVVTFSVGSATNGATANLSATTATIGTNGVAGVTATANSLLGSYTATATIPGSTGNAPATFVLTNVLPLEFSSISASQTVVSGTNVIFSGVLSNGQTSPVGQTIAITLDGDTQDAVIGAGGTFTTTFDTAAFPTSATPYTVNYAYTTDHTSFGDASTTSLLTITPLITFGPIGNQVYGVAPLTLAGTASAGLPVTYLVISGPASITGDVLTITGAGVVKIEADAGNSTAGFAPPVDESFTVSPATLTVHPTAGQSKVYGAAVPGLTESVTGFVDGDNSSLLSGFIGTVATTTSGVGTYAFTVGTLTAGPNYTIVVAGSPTFAVTPASLTVTPTVGQSKVYGAAVPTLTGTVSGFVNGDNSSILSGSLGTVATASSGVGSYTFTSGTLTAGLNYTFVVAASPKFTVTPASLTITPTAGQSKVYGSTVPTLTGTVSGFVNGDTSSLLSGSPGTVATSSSGVGTYAFTSGTLTAGANYTFVVAPSPTFAITPASLIVTAVAGQSKVYGAAVPTLTATATGFVNGDSSSLLTGSLGTTATTSSGVGTYTFTLGTLTAGLNYTVALAPSPEPTFAVTPATLIIDPTSGQSKLYGSPIPTLTYTAIGLVNGDTSAILSGSIGTTATTSSPIPAYYAYTLGTLTAGQNYHLVLETQAPSFVVNRAPLTITPTAGQSKVYGAADPALTYTATGFVNGDTTSLLTGKLLPIATMSSPVGTYAITLGSLFAGPDYILSLAASTPTFAVTPATLTVNPTPGQSKVFGAPVPALTETVTGLVNGDQNYPSLVTGAIGTTATATSPTGTYPFTLGTLNAGPNYVLTISSLAAQFSVTTNPTDRPPVVVNETYTTIQGNALTTTTSNGVLAGDTDPNHLPLTAVLVSSPAHGKFHLAANGTFTYAPTVGYSGTDSFTYMVNDGNSNSTVATVTLIVKTPVAGDFFGTGLSDAAVYLVNQGDFAIQPATGGPAVIVPFGTPGAGQTIPAPGNYFGTGQTDIAAYLPAQGVFAIRNPAGGPDQIIPFGIKGAGQTIPAPGDYFGTGQDDIAIYLPSLGAFAIRNPAGGPDEMIPFGMAGLGNSIPVPGDYDGSGKTELAVYMPTLGEFAYRPANGGPDVVVKFGMAGLGNSIPAPGDYDGSGKTEFAVYLPSLGEFAYRPANGSPDVVEPFGIAGAGQTLPEPGDYTGVGHDELAVFLPSTATFAIRPGGGQPDISGSFGAAGLGQTIPVTVVDQALAELPPQNVNTLSIQIPEPSTITDTVIFPTVATTSKKKKHATN